MYSLRLKRASESQEAVSRFAGVNPVVRQSSGTSGVGLASGAGFIWNPSSKINLTALYGSVTAPIATGNLSTGNALGSGFLSNDNVSGGLSFGTNLPVNVNGSAVYTSFMGGVHFSDVFAPGNTAAIIFGKPLYAESTGGNAGIAANIPGVFKFARPFHVEGYYRFKVNDNISITPGVFAVFNPESNSESNTAVVGFLRASFTF